MTLYRETPCEHGYSVAHCLCDHRTVECPGWCPGGSREEVTVDYEAAAQELMQIRPAIPVDVTFPVKRIVDAALHTERETASTVGVQP